MKLMAPIVPEDAEHLALARALTVLIAPPGMLSPAGVAWWSTEHRNAAGAAEGARRKARGVVAGIPDVCIRVGPRSYHIELKRKGGRSSPEQRVFHSVLRALGDEVAICEGADAAIAQLAEWCVPMRGRVSA